MKNDQIGLNLLDNKIKSVNSLNLSNMTRKKHLRTICFIMTIMSPL